MTLIRPALDSCDLDLEDMTLSIMPQRRAGLRYHVQKCATLWPSVKISAMRELTDGQTDTWTDTICPTLIALAAILKDKTEQKRVATSVLVFIEGQHTTF